MEILYALSEKSPQKISEDNEDANVRCFRDVIGLLEKRLLQGRINPIKAVWTYYSNRFEQNYHVHPKVYRSNRLKQRIQDFLGGSVAFLAHLNRSEPHLIVSSNLGEIGRASCRERV